jgi:mono/diheme cytochrome c family protein
MLASLSVRTWAAAVLAALALAVPSVAPADDTAATDPIARGQYLTHGAGQCEDCHGAGLVGFPTPPGPPGAPWAMKAPSLVGLPMFRSDEKAIAFLTTGVLPSGKHAMPPMPQYRFNTADATAIVAYLRSLK